MNVNVNVIILSVDWESGNFFFLQKDWEIPQDVFMANGGQPKKQAAHICSNIIDVPSSWMKLSIRDPVVIEDQLDIFYSCVIPMDTPILDDEYKWVSVSSLSPYVSAYLKQLVGDSMRDIS